MEMFCGPCRASLFNDLIVSGDSDTTKWLDRFVLLPELLLVLMLLLVDDKLLLHGLILHSLCILDGSLAQCLVVLLLVVSSHDIPTAMGTKRNTYCLLFSLDLVHPCDGDGRDDDGGDEGDL